MSFVHNAQLHGSYVSSFAYAANICNQMNVNILQMKRSIKSENKNVYTFTPNVFKIKFHKFSEEKKITLISFIKSRNDKSV